MKKISFLFLFLSVYGMCEEGLYQEAFHYLRKKEFSQTENLLLEILKQNPQSEKAKHNLAYTFFLKGEKEKSLAYQRQAVFQNPYLKSFLPEEKKWSLFWLYIPSDLVGVILFVTSCGAAFLLRKRRYSYVLAGMVLWGIVHGFGAVYAYHRYGVDYATVIEEVPVFSAPDPKASVLFHQLPGALVKIRNIKEKFFHIENTEKLGGWVPVQALIPVKASSLK